MRVYALMTLALCGVMILLILLFQVAARLSTSGEIVAFSSLSGIDLWDGSVTLKISDHPPNTEPVWSKDGRLAWNSGEDVYLWKRGKLTKIPSHEPFYDRPQWSDDGKLLVANALPGGFFKLGVWDGEKIIDIGQQLRVSRPPVWSSDGWLAWMMYRDDRWSLYVWDGEKTFNVESEWETEDILTWSKDGRLAWRRLTADRSEIYVWDRQTVERLHVEYTPNVIAPPVWSPDNQLAWLINNGNEFQVCIWTRCTPPTPGIASRLAWSDDGRVAWEGESNTASNSDIFVWDGQTVSHISYHPDEEYVPVWSKDGLLAWTVYEGGTNSEIYVWDGQEIINVSDDPGGDISPQWLASGALMWMSNRNQGHYRAYLWDGEKTISLKGYIGDHAFPPTWFIK